MGVVEAVLLFVGLWIAVLCFALALGAAAARGDRQLYPQRRLTAYPPATRGTEVAHSVPTGRFQRQQRAAVSGRR